MNQQHRYDPDEAQRILARAADLQQRDRETLSAEQLEALASEIGLSPEFVRRALHEHEAAPLAPNLTLAAPPVQRRRARVTRRDTVITGIGAIVPAIVLGLLVPGRSTTATPFLAIFLLALLLILTLGFRHPSRRLGAAGGALFGTALLATLLATLGAGGPNVLGGLLVIAGVSALLGAAGAAGRRLWDRLPSERRGDEAGA